jgi:hypothetical protein
MADFGTIPPFWPHLVGVTLPSVDCLLKKRWYSGHNVDKRMSKDRQAAAVPSSETAIEQDR